MRALSIYIHIPFCRRRCPYCDFVVLVDANPKVQPYLEACLKELKIRLSALDKSRYELTTIYFGGGTPSLVAPELIESFLTAVGDAFSPQKASEITMECNPEDFGLDFERLHRAGINRLSLGTQSVLDTKLLLLGRMHRRIDVDKFFANARAAGLENISCDLIYGTPGESIPQLTEDLLGLTAFSPTHISAYELTIERGTNFFEQIHDKKLKLPPDKAIEDQMIFLDETLSAAGFEHYEISNYAKPGYASLHNSAYWKQKEYFGLGIGAHSFVDGIRSANTSSMKEYMAKIAAETLAISFSELLTLEQRANEILLLGFRNKNGIDLEMWQKDFGSDLLEVCSVFLNKAMSEGFYERIGKRLVPTLKGMMVADSLAAGCMAAVADKIKNQKTYH